MSTTAETFEFQTEARQLLDLMIHSVYSNKDIFLRELISNASDAMDKRKFEAVKHPELLGTDENLEIFIDTDSEARTVTVRDRGIGMNREEVISLIGTIARSGTKEFAKLVKEAKGSNLAPELIGQFGVGFYSTFMVADSVTLETRRAGEEGGVRWHSTGDGTYTLEDIEKDEVGTDVTVHLRPVDEEDGVKEYTDEWTIREIVKKYSDYVAYPIKMNVEREEIERDEDGKPKEGAEPVKTIEINTLNSMKAIWLRDKSDVSDDELKEFYKHISHDWNEPMETIRAKIEGTLEYRLLLFLPSKAPMDLFYRDSNKGVHLYVKRVFIMDDCTELVPEYLRFLRGVVDSEDLSLNVSREILQKDRNIERMRKGLVSKVLDSLRNMKKNDPDKFKTFWKEFGRALKEGIFQDRENQKALLELSRFESTFDDADGPADLQGYLDRMKDGQEDIYYLTGESLEVLRNSPHLEAFAAKGYEVLLLSDPVDEVWVTSVMDYEGKRFVSASEGAASLGSEEDKKKEEKKLERKKKKFGDLLTCLTKHLEAHVKEVRLSSRLTSSAACLVRDQGDLSPHLEQLMRSMNQVVPETKRILELNPDHAVMKKLQEVFDTDADAPLLSNYAQLLYGQALLAEGGQLPDPAAFSKLVADLMTKAV